MRLIDADALIECIYDDIEPIEDKEPEMAMGAIAVLNMVKKAPTELEIVLCKDCKWAEKAVLDKYCVECAIYHTSCARHGYCHHGERKEKKQVTSKLNNPDDSLVREDSEACKKQKSKLESDVISRQAAIEAMWKALYTYEDLTEKQFMEHEELELKDWFQHRIFVQRMHEECMKSIESLPPVNQKQITGKLKNPCDSLLTEDSEGVKEQKSKLESEKVQLSPETSTNEGVAESATTTDCISRADAINVRCAHCDTRDCCRDCSEVEILLSLPPVEPVAESATTIDEVVDFNNMISVGGRIRNLPPVEPERPKGEWKNGRELSRLYIGDALRRINYEDWHCSNCHYVVEQSIKPEWSYCPNCGADMRGEEE